MFCFLNLLFCRCCTQSASYDYKNKSATNGAQLVPIGIPSLLIYTTTKFHIYVINQKLNHSNNINLWIFILRVTFILNKYAVLFLTTTCLCLRETHSRKEHTAYLIKMKVTLQINERTSLGHLTRFQLLMGNLCYKALRNVRFLWKKHLI